MNDERINGQIDIERRALAYAVRAIKLVRHLESKRDCASSVIARQFLRSAMSIGANMSEAQSAETKRDFVHKCTLSLKEARESHYWLRLILAADLVEEKRMSEIMNETNQLIAIITTIVKRTKLAMS
jgi:four helix bundle protein